MMPSCSNSKTQFGPVNMLPSCSNSKTQFGLSMATTPDSRKRDAAQSSSVDEMSAAAVSFFLDREGHKKFLRTAANQELEVENRKLKEELASKTEECGHWYTETHSLNEEADSILRELQETQKKLRATEQHRDYVESMFKK